MGSDDLHHKRKKMEKQMKRKTGTRKSYDRILIVCEGAKTEPLYFNALIEKFKLQTVEVCSPRGSDPMSIVNAAQTEYQASKNANNTFDKVFCVFDKDGHSNYKNAINKIRSKAKDTFFAVTSVPCFEVWFLLHFTITTKPFSITGTKSAADNVIAELEKHPKFKYKKNTNIFNSINHLRSNAIKNAKTVNKETLLDCDTDNPSTEVVYLVEYLIELSKQDKRDYEKISSLMESLK